MRDQLHLMELVDNYLDGTMNTNDRAAFEERLRTNEELRSLVEDQQHLRRAARRSPVRAEAKTAYRKYRWGKMLPGIGAGVVLLIAAVATILLWNTDPNEHRSDRIGSDEAILRTLDDTTGTRLEPFVVIIDPKRDTTLATPGGIVLDIPRGAFTDSLGDVIDSPVRVTLLEALNALDIMKAGLSTMSGGSLLETGGMFYLDAQSDGQPVQIDPTKPLTAMVPGTDGQGDMQLYAGVKTKDGSIDWRDPKPLKKSLVPVDITMLNFYPPGYEAKLAELGLDVMNKDFTDSVYWSLQRELEGRSRERWEWVDARKEFAIADTIYSPGVLGQTLFYAQCSSCHKTNQDMTGPALKGARSRWQGNGNIYDFVRDPQSVLKTGNKYVIDLFERWNKSVMTSHDLTDEEIDAILYFCDQTRDLLPGIDPAKIKTIWTSRFNNTNLATKEFEERLAYIFRTCDNALLDVYVNNLDKDLYWCDSVATRMHSEPMSMFLDTALGRVDLPAHAADRLRTYYENQSRTEAEAIRKTQEKFWNEQRKQDVRSDAKRADHAMAERVREGALFQKELQANMDTVYAQLGLKHRWLPRSAWVVPITSPGWWNVDIAVIEATATRSSMSYTDDKTGKTATLTYTPLIIQVADRASYDDLVVYLLPNQLNSYQRVKEVDGVFSERLNSIFTYEVFCLGMKGGQQFAFSAAVDGSSELTATMSPADDNSLRQMLRAKGKLEQELLQEASHIQWLHADNDRRRTNLQKQELRAALLPVVFPCSTEESRSMSFELKEPVERSLP